MNGAVGKGENKMRKEDGEREKIEVLEDYFQKIAP